MTAGYDETLRDPAKNRYAGVATDQGSTRRSLPSMTDNPTLSTKKAHFIPQKGELSSYYYNGPSTDPYDHHSALQNQIQAQVAWWSDPLRGATLDHYAGLLATYGHTNSPGTLWALAQSGLDVNTEAVQQMLTTDATAYNADYQQGLPAATGSPQQQATMAQTPAEEGSSPFSWDIPQFITRNAFSALSMPMEAVQGAWRSAGGVISDPEASLGEKILAPLQASAELVAPPLAAITDGLLVPDDEWQNPWEQTDFGQQLISAAGGSGMDAFTSQTAGLDTTAAKELLANDPAYDVQRQEVMDNPALMGATLEDIAKNRNLRGGAGWFIDESSQIGEAQRQSTYNSWAIPGPNGAMTAWTLGRGISSAIGGPDWAGYNFTSGMIDAVAAIAGDPTIWGGKLGLVSKTARGAGLLLEKGGLSGAEMALTVGKEARKVRQGVELVNRNSQKALSDYNKMNPGKEIDPAEWAGMDLSDQISLVHQVERGKKTQEAIDKSVPGINVVVRRIKDMRRAASEKWRGEKQLTEGFTEAERLTREQGLWADYAANVGEVVTRPAKEPRVLTVEQGGSDSNWHVLWDGEIIGTSVSKSGASSMRRRILAKDAQDNLADEALAVDAGPPQTVFSGEKAAAWEEGLSPEDAALWGESTKYIQGLIDSGRLSVADAEKNPEEWFRQLDAVIGTHFKERARLSRTTVPRGKLHGDVEQAAALSVIDNSGNLAAQVLKDVDYAGSTLSDAEKLQAGVLQRGVHDGQDVMSGWVGDVPPELIDSTVTLTPEIGQRILARVTEILKHPDHKTVKPAIKKEEKGSLADQAANQIKEFENPLPNIGRRLSSPGFTYGALFHTFENYGLDGYLDDILREEKIDGIKGILPDNGGVWMGDHPLMEHYKFPESAVDNATTLGGISDEAARAAAAAALPKTAVRTGLRGSNEQDVAAWSVQATGNHAKAAAKRVKENTTAIEQARAAELRLQNDLADLDGRFSNSDDALRSFLSYEAGITSDAAKGVNVNMEAMRWFLFGTGPTAALRARVLSKMANMLSESEIRTLKRFKPGTKEYDTLAGEKVAELAQITRGKWEPSVYKAVLRNAIDGGGEDGLLKAIGPHLGINGVERGSISRGVKLIEGSDGMKTMQTWRQSNRITKRWVNRMTSERPGGRVVSLDNSQDVMDALVKYMMYAKVPVKDINAAIGRVILADGTFGAVSTNVDVLKKSFTQIGNVLSARLADSNVIFQGTKGESRLKELQAAMHDSVNLFLSGATGEKNDLAARIGAQGDFNGYIDEFGEAVEYPRVQLDSELLNGEIHLPSVDEWQAGMGRMAAALHRFSPVEKTYDIARSVYDNFFRTSLLVFRGAYVIRNSAEMQIRMFLNGHHSIFNDPATLIGMTLGNFTKQGRESILNDFAKYTDTILGEAFDAGPDKAIAFANKTEKYFSLIREAHALTDPRVYQSTIYKGWQRVTVDGTRFSAGWANELIMLHNSPISRVVLGNIPYDFTAQQGFRTIPDAAVSWMLSARDDARLVRERLIGADPKFQQIFASEAMTRDYLFDNPNSVLNRIKQFTMDDADLVSFVKTGVMNTKDKPIHLKQIPQLKDRITSIRGALHDKFYESGKAKPEVIDHMNSSKVTVSWIDAASLRKGSGFVDGFFRVANNIERLGSVGPEFRMAYWDRLAELLPGLRSEDIARARSAAKTTLNPIQRMNPDGIAGNVGHKHPAWKALDKAEKENTAGLMTLDELHTIAMDFAADHVKNLFYDAARRNNFWTATRLIFPFGQAWGNTIAEWTKLGAKRPAKVYEALKALNAAGEEGSSTIYETGQALGAFGDYEQGMAPWDQDPNGGFFYSDQYGDTSFMLPYVGRAAAVPANILARLNGYDANIGSIDMSSNTQSMNLALGSESISPGTSFLVPMGLSLFPDSDLVDGLQNIAAPYGPRNAMESSLPAWASNFLGGVGALPIVGDVVADWVSPFSASVKNKNARDAVAILSATGQYDLSDPISVRKMQDDANNLAPSLLLISGMFKNVMPVNPTQQLSVDTGSVDSTKAAKQGQGTQAAFAIVNNLYQQMLEEAGGDTTTAKEEFVRQFGAPFLFVVTGNKKGYSRIPSSDAMRWARASSENMDTARAFPDYFSLFFPKGDPTDLTAKLWIEQQTNKSTESKTVEEVTDESISLMIRTQRARIDALEVNGDITADQADLWRKDIETTYEKTTPGQTFNSMTTGDQLTQVDAMLEQNPTLRDTGAGKAYGMAMQYRGDALAEARARSGEDSTTLSGKKVAPLKAAYLTDLEDLLTQYPDFRPLYNILSKEWD